MSNADRYQRILFTYKNSEDFYPGKEFKKITGGEGDTKAFRNHLHSFISSFERKTLIPRRPYVLAITSEGQFELINKEDGKGIKDPPSDIKVIYDFACFIETARFWQEYEKMRDMNVKLGPLVIKDLDKSIDKPEEVSKLIDKAKALDRDVLTDL